MTKTNEKLIAQGTGNMGNKFWTVYTITDGKIKWTENFTSEAEALSWIKWA